ncbi:MAG TPA: hypothetical protein VNB49_12840 [Candidatus Dormibacteraeota bacterium]|nr:hypothetical protein [Candidatus Dormibacteraeota bacterium]
MKVTRITCRHDIPFGGGTGRSVEMFSSFLANDPRPGGRNIDLTLVMGGRFVLVSRPGDKSRLVPMESIQYLEIDEEQSNRLLKEAK